MPLLVRRSLSARLVRIIAAALAAGETADATFAAPLIPGSIVIATAPGTGSGPTAITLTEYPPDFNSPRQAFTIPSGAPTPYGATVGSATTVCQIAFPADDQQSVLVATSYTNTTSPRNAGFVRCDFSGPAPGVAEASPSGDGAVDGRGVAAISSTVFASTGLSLRRRAGTTWEVLISGNCRWIERHGGDVFVSTSSSSGAFSAGNGIYRLSESAPAPGAPSPVLILAAEGANPLGFAIADAQTIYLAIHAAGGGYDAGLYKFRFNGAAWTNEGRLAAISVGQAVSDVDAAVSGGTASVYVITDTTIWSLQDALSSSGATWQVTPATPRVPGLSRGRSIAIVPTPPPPECACRGDLNLDGAVNGADLTAFVACVIHGGPACACADVNANGGITPDDVGPMLTRLVTEGGCL